MHDYILKKEVAKTRGDRTGREKSEGGNSQAVMALARMKEKIRPGTEKDSRLTDSRR